MRGARALKLMVNARKCCADQCCQVSLSTRTELRTLRPSLYRFPGTPWSKDTFAKSDIKVAQSALKLWISSLKYVDT